MRSATGQKARVRAKCVRAKIVRCEVRACGLKSVTPNTLLVLEFPGLLIPIHFLDCILAEIDKLSRSPMLLDTIYYIYLSHFALRMPKIYLLLAK